jgi:ribosomal protein S18 acetylase RimI-like enzyme
VNAVTVRAATPADHVRIGDVLVDAYLAAGVMAEGYDTVLRDVATRAEHTDMLVAELDGTVVGTVAIAHDLGPYAEAQATKDELEFRMLAVDPAVQGAGVGTALLDAVLVIGIRKRRGSLVLSTLDTNVKARDMYARRGFRRVPERDFSPVPGVDLLVQVQDLPLHCPHCGAALPDGGEHVGCPVPAAELEPDRYCPVCARRLVVQVLPGGWTARCSEHGDVTPTT